MLKATPVAAIFGQDMLFDIPLHADWSKIGDIRQHQIDLNLIHEKTQLDLDPKIGDKVLLQKDGISEIQYDHDP